MFKFLFGIVHELHKHVSNIWKKEHINKQQWESKYSYIQVVFMFENPPLVNATMMTSVTSTYRN